MQPPVAGMFSPPSQVRFVVASSIGFRMGTAEAQRPATRLLQRRGPSRATGYSVDDRAATT